MCFASLLCLLALPFFTAEADMMRSGFVSSALSISPGDSVIFVNPADGVPQVLCIGSHEECFTKPAKDDPPQLDRGLRLLPGQSVSVAFHSTGDYPITSQTTPNMNITIQVSPLDEGGE